ncbi:MAG: hypothetical protein E2P03_03505 [Acidobacteria bacterium]|nr:MAG: hypothetical protein E2P03_03505 [Acidobacteriota bacterium]
MKTKMTKGWILGMALLLMAAGPAIADQTVNESVDMGSGSRISVENIAGSVRVVGHSGSTVEITGTLGDDVEELLVEKQGNRLNISVELPQGGHKRNLDAEADLVIHVPFDSELEVETISAIIEISDVRGEMELESISGSIDVDGEMSVIELSTISGNISVAAGSSLQEGSFESISGSIECAADLSDNGEFDFETVSGDITLFAPRDFAAEWDIETFSGAIENIVGPEAERTSQYAPGKELRFTTGGGGASISMESLSGRVVIREN